MRSASRATPASSPYLLSSVRFCGTNGKPGSPSAAHTYGVSLRVEGARDIHDLRHIEESGKAVDSARSLASPLEMVAPFKDVPLPGAHTVESCDMTQRIVKTKNRQKDEHASGMQIRNREAAHLKVSTRQIKPSLREEETLRDRNERHGMYRGRGEEESAAERKRTHRHLRGTGEGGVRESRRL